MHGLSRFEIPPSTLSQQPLCSVVISHRPIPVRDEPVSRPHLCTSESLQPLNPPKRRRLSKWTTPTRPESGGRRRAKRGGGRGGEDIQIPDDRRLRLLLGGGRDADPVNVRPPRRIGVKVRHGHRQRRSDRGEEGIDRVVSGGERRIHDADNFKRGEVRAEGEQGEGD